MTVCDNAGRELLVWRPRNICQLRCELSPGNSALLLATLRTTIHGTAHEPGGEKSLDFFTRPVPGRGPDAGRRQRHCPT
jgi:hypothetical protein